MNDKKKLDELKKGKKSGILYILGKEEITMDEFPAIKKVESEIKEKEDDD
jgi:hypothetical protein